MDPRDTAPDSWELEDDVEAPTDAQLQSALARLNVNAKPFVPNVHAAEFVPAFFVDEPSENTGSGAAPAAESSPPDEPVYCGGSDAVTIMEVSDTAAAPVENGEAEMMTEESWEQKEEPNEAEPGGGTLRDGVPPDEGAQEMMEDEEELPTPKVAVVPPDAPKKEHVNVVFIGHVDAGKSTIGGQIMYLTGMVDKRTLEKYEREAKEKNRETWYLSWALDTNQEERDKGKTVEVGRAYFETEKKHFTILDAPGHKSFVPNMIGGASQADLAVLVISARKGEFETGFEKGGQTREHAMLAKTAGVKHLIVLVNKMDDPTVNWSLERYEECKEKLVPFLKKVGFNPKKDIHFMPCSGLTGANLKEPAEFCTWYSYLSWALDTNQEERDKGKTVEVGRAYFETEKKHFTILDAPGHKSFVPNMIGGASQADLAVLVISARKGEFETGFEKGGQTREHAMLAKTAGVKHLIVLVNKMDDPTVNWSLERYEECKEKLVPFLKKVGFNPKKDIHFMPCSGLTGANLKEPAEFCTWYSGLPFIPHLDSLPNFNRSSNGPVRLAIVDKYKDMGTVVLGKLESGCISKAQQLVMMPNKHTVEVLSLLSDDVETDDASPGENLKLRLKGIEEEEILPGFILCNAENLCHSGRTFDAQIVIIEHKSIICPGYNAVLHIHTCIEEVQISALICLVDKKTGEKSKTRPRFVKQDQVCIARLRTAGTICLETFKDFPQMGRFTLRDEGKTIAIGKVLKLVAEKD
ncbi:UNVERIFIED_CONTAM: hypothetical protein FKN15_041177 [Acipenser sinensis]